MKVAIGISFILSILAVTSLANPIGKFYIPPIRSNCAINEKCLDAGYLDAPNNPMLQRLQYDPALIEALYERGLLEDIPSMGMCHLFRIKSQIERIPQRIRELFQSRN